MSYYGVRSIKFVKNDQGLFNVSGKFYDSSIRNLDGTRHWHESIFFNTWRTKEEMEDILFRDILDGNIHYTGGGKYALIKRLFVKDDEELKRLIKLKEQALDNLYDYKNKQSNLGNKYEQYQNDIEFKRLYESVTKTENDYDNYRYNLYKDLWLKKIEEDKVNKKGKGFIMECDGRGYVKSLTSRRMVFTIFGERAKVFKISLEELKQKLKGYNNEIFYIINRETREKVEVNTYPAGTDIVGSGNNTTI